MTGAEFKRRIEAQHVRHTGGSPRGAQAWFARLVDRKATRVWAWTKARLVPGGSHVRILQILESVPPGTPWAVEPKTLERLPADFPRAEALIGAGLDTPAKVFYATSAELLEAGLTRRDIDVVKRAAE